MGDTLPKNSNTVSGTVEGPVVQARVIQGDVHVHHTAVAQVVPRQLPPAPAYFAERHVETGLLDRFMIDEESAERPRLVALTGPGGAGKTATALNWLHQNSSVFPDGHLYADLGAFGPNGPTATSAVLSGFLRALGVPATDIPLELSEQSALYRSVAAGKAIVVFADDAESVAQVRPLLPPSHSSALLTTSRRRLGALSLDGARFVPVDVLDERSAIDLVRHVLGERKVDAEPQPARELVRLCGGLPIALRVAAARLLSRPRWSISRIVTALTDERRRLASLSVSGEASIQASLDLSYAELAPDAARLYRLLGLHPGPEFDVGAAAAVAGLDLNDADDLAEELVDVSLADEISDHRFRMHDLVRLHAGLRAEEDDETAERAAAERRVVEWYLDSTIAADLVVMPRRQRVGQRYETAGRGPAAFPTAMEALDWLDAELSNLAGAQRRAADRGWWDLVWQQCEALWGLFLFRKRFEHWIPTHELGIEAARRCATPAALTRLLVQLGFAYLNLQRHDTARAHFVDALAVSRTAADPRAVATALEHLGLAERAAGRPSTALGHFAQALAITEQFGPPRGTALHLRRLGETLTEVGREGEAVHTLRRAVDAATELDDPVLRARALTRLAAVHTRLDHLTTAHDQLSEAARILGNAGSAQYRAEVLETLAELHLRAGDQDLARQHLEQALNLYRGSQLPRADQVRERLNALNHPCPPRQRHRQSEA